MECLEGKTTLQNKTGSKQSYLKKLNRITENDAIKQQIWQKEERSEVFFLKGKHRKKFKIIFSEEKINVPICLGKGPGVDSIKSKLFL